MRKLTALLAVIIIFALLGAGCGRKKNEAIALVNGQPITKSQLFDALEQADNGQAGRQALDSLIVRQLIRQEAQKRGLQVDPKELDGRLEAVKDYVLAATGKDFKTWLEDTGQTEEELASRISTQILTANLVLTEEDSKKYFEENQDRLKSLPHNTESVIYREIILPSKEEAEAVRKELLAAATEGKVTSAKFAETAEARTLNPVEKQRGGMAGWLVKGKSGDPELEKVLFQLTPGQVSEPLPMTAPGAPEAKGKTPQQAQFWRLVSVEKKIEPGPITLERNADVIEEWMLNDPRFQLQLQEFFTNIRAKADVQITPPRYRSLAEAYKQGREARERRMSQPSGGAPTGPGTPLPPATGAKPEPRGK